MDDCPCKWMRDILAVYEEQYQQDCREQFEEVEELWVDLGGEG